MAMRSMPSPKQATLQLVERLEEDITFEDIIYELYVLEKIQRGMRDAEEGRVVSISYGEDGEPVSAEFLHAAERKLVPADELSVTVVTRAFRKAG